MSSNTLSSWLEKKIHQLCLNDFPCGHGGSGKTKDSADGAEREETDDLLDLLSCPRSPWHTDESWSPQTTALRQLAAVTPRRLDAHFIYGYFTTLRVVDKGVSVIDDGLLKFSKLEELVLSANAISEIPAENLPRSLKVLELRANRLSGLYGLARSDPPPLHYLGLGSNTLGHSEDATYLTGSYWPQLVCLDLSDCEFQHQPLLLDALETLPRLRSLVLEGNPFTLASCYPGFTVDRLPKLTLLDAAWISPEDRHSFRNLAQTTDLIVERASATVSLGRVRGIPNPATTADQSTPDFPVVTYSYFITYDFLCHQRPAHLKCSSESRCDAAEVGSIDAELQTDKNDEKEAHEQDERDPKVDDEDTCCDCAHVSSHSSSKVTWSECMDFSDSHTHIITDLGGLKRFLQQGLDVRIVEEKVLSWPVVSEEAPVAKPSRPVKEKTSGKGKESCTKSASTKDKKKKSLPELVQDDPIRTVLGSVHVPLQELILRGRKVSVLCDFGDLHKESEATATQRPIKDLGKRIKEDKKMEDKESKRRGGSSAKQKNTTSSKGKGKEKKDSEVDVTADDHASNHLEPVTVEFSVELEKWRSASEAQQHLLRQQNTNSKQQVSP